MELVLVIAATVALVAAAPQGISNDATILEEENIPFKGFGPWNWRFRTSNGISREENGVVQNEGTAEESIEVRGSYSWTAPDGITYTVHYVSNKDGFQPAGDHLPTQPSTVTPIPAIPGEVQLEFGGLCDASLASLCG